MKPKILASLVTREGFSKEMELYDLIPVIRIPKFPKSSVTGVFSEDMPKEVTIENMEFYLDKHKEVRNSRGHITHIVAVYYEG